jgi:hypothetical protein
MAKRFSKMPWACVSRALNWSRIKNAPRSNDAEAGDQIWAALTEAFNDPAWEPKNPVVGGESDSGEICPVEFYSQPQFVRLQDVGPVGCMIGALRRSSAKIAIAV